MNDLCLYNMSMNRRLHKPYRFMQSAVCDAAKFSLGNTWRFGGTVPGEGRICGGKKAQPGYDTIDNLDPLMLLFSPRELIFVAWRSTVFPGEL